MHKPGAGATDHRPQTTDGPPRITTRCSLVRHAPRRRWVCEGRAHLNRFARAWNTLEKKADTADVGVGVEEEDTKGKSLLPCVARVVGRRRKRHC